MRHFQRTLHLFLAAAMFHPFSVKAYSVRACVAQWPPFVTVDGNANVGGEHTDLLMDMAEQYGHTVDITEVPWKRCLKMAEQGEVDLVYPISYKKERAEYLLYPERHHHEAEYVFVIKSGTAQGWDANRDLAQLPQPIGVVNGYAVTEVLEAEEGVHVESGAVGDLQNLNKLANGRVDAILIDRGTLEALRVVYNQLFQVLEPVYDSRKYYITVTKGAFGHASDAKSFMADVEAYLSEREFDVRSP